MHQLALLFGWLWLAASGELPVRDHQPLLSLAPLPFPRSVDSECHRIGFYFWQCFQKGHHFRLKPRASTRSVLGEAVNRFLLPHFSLWQENEKNGWRERGGACAYRSANGHFAESQTESRASLLIKIQESVLRRGASWEEAEQDAAEMLLCHAMSSQCANMTVFLTSLAWDLVESGPLSAFDAMDRPGLDPSLACLEPALEELIADLDTVMIRDQEPSLWTLTAGLSALRAVSMPCLLGSLGSHPEIFERGSCFAKSMRLAISSMGNAGHWDLARRLFEMATTVYVGRVQLAPWMSFHFMPLPYLPQLLSKPFWESDLSAPIPRLISMLERNWRTLREEFVSASLSEDGRSQLSRDAYKETLNKEWVKMELFNCLGGWDRPLCRYAPKTCKLFIGQGLIASDTFPSFCACWSDERCRAAPQACSLLRQHGLANRCETQLGKYPLHEKVGWIILKANQAAPYHTGDSRRINLFVCLLGCEGAFVVVAGVLRVFEPGRVVSYQDGFGHLAVNSGDKDWSAGYLPYSVFTRKCRRF